MSQSFGNIDMDRPYRIQINTPPDFAEIRSLEMTSLYTIVWRQQHLGMIEELQTCNSEGCYC